MNLSCTQIKNITQYYLACGTHVKTMGWQFYDTVAGQLTLQTLPMSLIGSFEKIYKCEQTN